MEPSARNDQQHLAEAMRQREDELIAERRRQADVGGTETRPRVGLALSGGGIRSATISLGVVQSLARRGLLPHVDYLSTVSGGGYLGSFLGALFARRALPGHHPAAEAPGARHAHVKQVLTDEGSIPVKWLRDNGRYLTPNGSGDVTLAIAVAVRNWIAVLVVMFTFALTACVAVQLLMFGIDLALQVRYADKPLATLVSGGHWVGPWLWWSPWLLVSLLLFGLFAVPTGWAYWLVPMAASLNGRWNWTNVILPLLMTASTIVLCVLLIWGIWPFTAPQPDEAVNAAWVLGIVASLTMVTCIVVSIVAGKPPVYRNRIASLNAKAVGLLVLCTAWAFIDSLGRTFYAVWVTNDGMWPWLAGGAAAIGSLFAVVQQLTPATTAGKGALRIPMRVVAGAIALVLLVVVLGAVAAVGHGIAYHGEIPRGNPGQALIKPTTIDVALVTDAVGTVHARMPPPPATAIPAALATLPAFSPAPTTGPATVGLQHWETMLIVTAIGLLMCIGYAFILSFINQSSLAHTYGSRLTRSYLGASNPERQDKAEGDHARRVTNALVGDDLVLRPSRGAADDGYQPQARGGPLHLINITINETVDGRSGIQQLDRKGVPLAVGPAGISVSIGHHALWNRAKEHLHTNRDTYYLTPAPRPDGSWRVFEKDANAEALTVGQLVGISGAAFSTGIGSRTSLAFSLLCGLFNVRTGHWWQSGTEGPYSLTPVVQIFLLYEWLARFPGTAWNYWYLSDGGHFENLACYELIRRRVPFIICCDNGEDPTGALEDLGGLVRKARMDFATDLTFLTRDQAHELIDPALRPIIGGVDDLRPTPATGEQPAKQPAACAAIGCLRYADGTTGTLLLIKPGLIGGEPEDVRYYQRSHPAFPHEPTINQFFDEAQWESYRRLGEFMGENLFGQAGTTDRWNPAAMKPLTT